jgi:hypothetical protein
VVSSLGSTNNTRGVTFVMNQVISDECGKDSIMIENLSMVICDIDIQPHIGS